MKPIFQINHRHCLIRPAATTCYLSRKTDYDHQAAAIDDVDGGWVGACNPVFRAISQDYFANEAPQHFAHEAVLFFMMMMAVALPLLNAALAVLELIRT